MPLRRVTLSGRLAQYKNETPEPVLRVIIKGLFAMGFDTAVALGVAMLAYKVFMGSLAPPYERGFYCYEVDSINYPFQPNTVSSRQLLAVALAVPFFIMFCTEAIFFYYASGTNRLRKYFYSATYSYLEYLCRFTVVVLAMEGAKCLFARLRPHYLSVCKPDWSMLNCSNPNTYIPSAHCTGTDAHRIKIGRQSFPSGHSGAATLFLVFMYLYLTGLIKASGLGTLRRFRAIVITVIFLWTVFVIITRLTDHWHHPTDVLGGIVLGLFCAYFPFYRKDIESLYRRRLIEHPRSD